MAVAVGVVAVTVDIILTKGRSIYFAGSSGLGVRQVGTGFLLIGDVQYNA
jgi:hypothetical protein